jgi:hypothetical protein
MRKLRTCLTLGAVALAGILATAPASATLLTATQTQSIATHITGWTSGSAGVPLLTFTKFDTGLGVLTAVHFGLSSSVTGTARLESLDGAPASITATLSAQVHLARPAAADLVVVIPLISTVFNASIYDGTTDFAGTSGVTLPLASGVFSNSATSSAAGDLTLFSGPAGSPGTINLDAFATGNSSGTGAGNLLTLFQTFADASATLYYEYNLIPETQVPEPASVAMLGLAMVGLGTLRHRRHR